MKPSLILILVFAAVLSGGAAPASAQEEGGSCFRSEVRSGLARGSRVTERVPGLYDSIPRSESVEVDGLLFRTRPNRLNYGEEQAWRTTVVDADSGRVLGIVDRGLRAQGSELVLSSSELRDWSRAAREVPSFVNPPGTVPLVPGRGIPTQLYMTMLLMKQAGVKAGSLRTAEVPGLTNLRTLLELRADPAIQAFLKNSPKGAVVPERLIEEALPRTHTWNYLETLFIQAGHRIRGFRVKDVDMQFLAHVFPANERGNPELAHLTQGLVDQDRIPFGFAIRFDLEPLR